MQQSQQSIESSNSDHNLSDLKRQISLSSALLIQIISHNDKFSDKLKVLNQSGVDAIYNQDYQVAVVYLQEAEKVLEYAASCGKTIDRVLIISTLQNEACAYQRMWDLQKASNYLQAIIYNMNAYLQCAPQIKIDSQMCDPLSTSYALVSSFIRKKINTAFYYLQFSAVSSQIKKHDTALGSAFKALSVLKMVCEECFNYEKYVRKDEKTLEGPKMILRDLSCIKQTVELDKVEKYVSLAQRGLRKLKGKHQGKSSQDKVLEELSNFAIGQVMQISPISLFALENQQPKMREQVNYVQKIYKAIYISICFFAIATELRLIAFENYIEEKRQSSIEFRKSQLYHLNSIILASKYVPCETRYLQHIVKSYTNHYKIDLFEYSNYSEHSDPQTEHFPHHKILLTNQQSESETNLFKSSKIQTTKLNTLGSQKSFEKIKLPNACQNNIDMKDFQKTTARSKKSPKAQFTTKEEQLKNQSESQNHKKSFQKVKNNSSSKKYSYAHFSVNQFNLKKSILTPNGQKYQRPQRNALGSGTKSNCKIILSPNNRCRKSKEASKDYGKMNSKNKSKSRSKKKSKASQQKHHREKSGAKQEQKKRKTNKLHQQYFVQEHIHKKKKSKISHNTSNPKSMKKNNLHGNHHGTQKLKNGEYLSMSKQLYKRNEEILTYGSIQHGVRTSSKISHTKIKAQY